MENLKTSTKLILGELVKRYPGQTQFRKQQIVDVGETFGYSGKDWDPLMTKDNRVKIGTYNLSTVIELAPTQETQMQTASTCNGCSNAVNRKR